MAQAGNRWQMDLLLLSLVFWCGCASEPPRELPRGVAVPWSDVPKPVVDGFRREAPGEAIRRVESFSDGYLLETSSGSIIFMNQAGEWQGTIL